MFERRHERDSTTPKVLFKEVKEVKQNFAYQCNYASFSRIMECVIVPNFFELRFKSIRVCLKRVIKTDLRIVCPTMFFQYFLKIFCDQKRDNGRIWPNIPT